ncbi:MAG TPA: ATP synthase F1 subunit epsilon [Planctomycetota bacterium]|nr:ATP synthase F1 subunit epsilon [Planctomycetota bacterium]
MAEATLGKTLHVTVITPAKSVFDAQATSVVVPAFDGELGVMPGHAPLLALLGTGEMRLTTPNGETKKLALRGGFLQVNNNNVTVLTPEAASGEELKPDALLAELEKINAQKAVKLEERDAQEVKRQWVRARQKAVAK